MAKTFFGMVGEAMAEVPGISPQEARQRLQDDPNTLLIDVRDLEVIRQTGMAEGAIPISNGALPLRADHEVPESLRDERLQDRSRSVITICGAGPMSTLGAKTLKDMGFENVAYVEGGTDGWKAAGLPTAQPPQR